MTQPRPKQYRKKPVVIEAMRATPETAEAVARWCGGRVVSEAKPSDPTDVYIGIDIPTLEGVMRAETHSGGDYVIKGVAGEFYPCKAGIFEETYEQVGLR
ncbi:hypothetical protein M3B43_11875 [Nesterenkonia massiliensis]|uniref:Phage protein n=1 Tax=Nesterenkonia massiliensis TaxID=1232429 RepID=A0ABT2HU11_9MICC|nr:hypothetical protein [Nesterenkonia massiliensis]MCT1607999.1 hypothetical protein [Nesterenkonia massiliensis]